MSSANRIYLPFRRDERPESSSTASSASSSHDVRLEHLRQQHNANTSYPLPTRTSALAPPSPRYSEDDDGSNDDDDDAAAGSDDYLLRAGETQREAHARAAFTSPGRRERDLPTTDGGGGGGVRPQHQHQRQLPPPAAPMNLDDLNNALVAVLAPTATHQQAQQQRRADAETQRQFQQQQHQPSQLQLQHQQQLLLQQQQLLLRSQGQLHQQEQRRVGQYVHEEPTNRGAARHQSPASLQSGSDDDDDDEYDDEAEEEEDVRQQTAAQHGRGASPRGGGGGGAQDDGNNAQQQQQQLMDLSGEEYEPTEQEITEYCEWLGLDMTTDKCLVWIAREALRAPLPENWTMCYTDEREVYYFNVRTGESIWDHPMDAYYKSLYKEEKVKLDKKRKRSRSFRSALPVKPLAEFFSELSDTCGVGAIVLMEDEDILTNDGGGAGQPPSVSGPPPWNDVPDALIDPIDFRVFLDPVVLPTSGRTVSRHTIINNTWRDPFTREYCENRRLVPNVDKRSEVDKWLQNMVQAFVHRMQGGTLSGFQRLAAILPYLLDRDEEACVRGQTLVLGWLVRQVDQDRKYLAAVDEATKAALKRQQHEDELQLHQQQPPPRLSPRDSATAAAGRGQGLVSSKRSSVSQSSAAAASAKLSSRSGSVVSKSLESLPLPKLTTPRSASVAPTAQEASSSPAPVASAVPFPPRRTVLRELFAALPEDDFHQILLSLMTMSTSASREALLLLATHVPSIMQRAAVFGSFDDDIRFVLRIAKKDLSEIVQIADDAYTKMWRDQQQQQRTHSASASTSSQPFPQASPVSDTRESPIARVRSFTSAASGASGSARLSTPTSRRTGQLHDTSSDLRPSALSGVDDDDDDQSVPLDFSSVVRAHVVVDSERKLSLRWLLLLHSTPSSDLPGDLQHPLALLDIVSVSRLVLCCYASKLIPPTSAADAAPTIPSLQHHWDSCKYIAMFPRCQAWPQQVRSLPDHILRSLLELCAIGTEDPELQTRILFDLMLHGSERCMDVIVRHAAPIKASVLRVLQAERHADTAGATQIPPQEGEGGVASTPADLLAAILIFHDLASLEEIAAACAFNPVIALKVAYNLTPRLARSQWRPKHFHQTITSFATLVEEHREEAWRVVDRAGLHFFLRELSKKKNTAADVRVKIEALEASERQLEQSMTLARWGTFAKKLEHRRAVEIRLVLETRRKAKEARMLLTTQVNQSSVTTTSASPRGPGPTGSGLARQHSSTGLPKNANGTTQKPSPRTALPKISPRSASVVVVEQPSVDTLPQAAVEVRAIALADATRVEAEHALKKQQEIVAQRASLLSQALVMLITVRLKPKQNRSGGATAAAVALQLQHQQQQFQGESPAPNKQLGSSGGSAAAFVKSPPATRKAPTGVIMQNSGANSARSSRQATPRQLQDSYDANGGVGALPPPAPSALPTLRTLRAPSDTTTPPQPPMSMPMSSRRQPQLLQHATLSSSAAAVGGEARLLSGGGSFLPPI